MSTRKMSPEGLITIPKEMREALRLTAGDGVEFELNGAGDVVLRKSPPTKSPPRHRAEQLRRRAAELRSLLRGLD
jgi:AbrB family looped-hinge helix DNA binding protein